MHSHITPEGIGTQDVHGRWLHGFQVERRACRPFPTLTSLSLSQERRQWKGKKIQKKNKKTTPGTNYRSHHTHLCVWMHVAHCYMYDFWSPKPICSLTLLIMCVSVYLCMYEMGWGRFCVWMLKQLTSKNQKNKIRIHTRSNTRWLSLQRNSTPFIPEKRDETRDQTLWQRQFDAHQTERKNDDIQSVYVTSVRLGLNDRFDVSRKESGIMNPVLSCVTSWRQIRVCVCGRKEEAQTKGRDRQEDHDFPPCL